MSFRAFLAFGLHALHGRFRHLQSKVMEGTVTVSVSVIQEEKQSRSSEGVIQSKCFTFVMCHVSLRLVIVWVMVKKI